MHKFGLKIVSMILLVALAAVFAGVYPPVPQQASAMLAAANGCAEHHLPGPSQAPTPSPHSPARHQCCAQGHVAALLPSSHGTAPEGFPFLFVRVIHPPVIELRRPELAGQQIQHRAPPDVASFRV